MCRAERIGRGLWQRDAYLDTRRCGALLASIEAELRREPPVTLERPDRNRSLRYRVLDGHRIGARLPALDALLPGLLRTAIDLTGIKDLQPLTNRAAAINLNITPPGGEYRWHYDRNAVTAILYLNAVEGGETELLPGYRLHLGRWKHTALQRWLDRALREPGIRGLTATPVRVEPRPGRLLVMNGDRCLHSVCPVRGSRERYNLVMTFDRPRAQHRIETDLDPYLYSTSSTPVFDPNYLPPGRLAEESDNSPKSRGS